MILSKDVPSWGFIGIRFYLSPTSPWTEAASVGSFLHISPFPNPIHLHHTQSPAPSGPIWDLHQDAFPPPACCKHKLQHPKSIGKCPANPKSEKPWAPAQLVCRVMPEMVHGLRSVSYPKLPYLVPHNSPFVSQPISGGALCFIAINVQKINGK